MKTFRIWIRYDGSAYAGWQVQPHAATVQGVLETAAETLNGEPTRILGAGRTDAGVHALAQAARLGTTRDVDEQSVPRALNAALPEDVVVFRADEVAESFHPIRDAREKRYRYTFKVAPYHDPFDRGRVLRLDSRPDLDAMRVAAGALTGRHDFAVFEKTGSPRDSTVRTLSQLDVSEAGDYIQLHLVADGFLYGMARNLAGTLLRAGQGNLEADTVAQRFGSGDKDIAGPRLPARGLCLVDVIYADSDSTGRNS